MLRELVVENLGVIERAELELGEGSSALTGETGAGKTLVVSAMGLLLGGRSDRALIRHGAISARVEARFELHPGHPALELLRERDLVEPSVTEVIVARTVAEGGGKVRVNGRVAPVSLLSEIGPLLVEVAGQHEHQRLVSRRHQIELLDGFIGPAAVELATSVADAVRAASHARREAEGLEASERDRERELDILSYEIGEIEAAGIRAGESAELTREAARLEHAAAIADAVGAARDALDGEDAGLDRIREARDSIARVSDKDPSLDGLGARLDSALLELNDVAAELGREVPALDAAALEEIRHRAAALARLQRKYGADDAAVLSYLERARRHREDLERASSQIELVRERAVALEADGRAAAERLSALRREAAPGLQRATEDILGSLAMSGTTVELALEETELFEGGLERAELRVGSPGHPPRPLSKIASGGELSRIGLALRLASGGSAGSASTLVFDEVDAGVGGEAARAVGQCLAELSRRANLQVLVVTHLPQVAACADFHHHVKKVVAGGVTTAVVSPLEGEARVAELSRMLAGLPGSERAREHAQELLEIAGSA